MSVTPHAVLDALRPIQDPDLGRSIVDLGFIKNIRVEADAVRFDLVLTTPACPVRERLKEACEQAVAELEGVAGVEVTVKAETRGASTEGRKVLEGVRNIVAVASGKGGVAKSTTAVNLAVGLQRTGARVGILDADIYGPSLPTMVRVDEEPSVSPTNEIHPARGAGLSIISIGFFMPPGRAAILRGPMVSGYISQFLANVRWGELDYLIIDYPPGTGDIQLTLSQQAAVTGAVLCTTPQDVALMDVHKAVAMFNATKIPVLGVVETMSYFVCDHCQTKHHIFGEGGGQRVATACNVPLLGQVPIDRRVVEGGDVGLPIITEHPDSPAAAAYREVVGAVAARLATINLQGDRGLESFALAWEA